MTPWKALPLLALGGALVLCSAAPGAVPPTLPFQDADGRQERAERRVEELYHLRMELLLDDLVASGVELSAEEREHAGERLRAACTDHLAAGEVRFADMGPISFQATPLSYPAFHAFLTTETWTRAVDEALPEAAAAALRGRMDGRRAALVEALVRCMGSKLAQGLCLDAQQVSDLHGLLDGVAREQLAAGELVAPAEGNVYYGNQPKELFFDRLRHAGLLDALDGPHGELLGRMRRQDKRTALDDLWLEAEYLVRGRPDADVLRGLLRGGSDALLHRGGRAPRVTGVLLQPVDARPDSEWDRILRGVLDLEPDHDLSVLPSRTRPEWVDARAAFLLAAVDERVILTDVQREALAPLLRELAEEERQPGRRRRTNGNDPELLVPSELGMGEDGRMVPTENAQQRGTTRVRALVQTLNENLTPTQRELLES